MAKSAIDYTRILRVCGYDEEKINQKVLHFLNQTLSVTAAEFATKIKKAAEEIQSLSLVKYHKPATFKAAWELTSVPPPLNDWDFLSCASPDKTGILCEASGSETILLTQESLDPLELFGNERVFGNAAYDLYFWLCSWREAVSCVWAGVIINGIIKRFKTKKLPAALQSGLDLPPDFSVEKKTSAGEPIGAALNLFGISDKEAEDFCNLYKKTQFGLVFCEHDASQAFKQWLRGANIDTLRKHGLDFKKAHALLMAGSQREPRTKIDLCWDQKAGCYQFVCLITNIDSHGYENSQATTCVPVSILYDFFATAPPKTKEDLFRLLICAGCGKARNLLRTGLEKHFD